MMRIWKHGGMRNGSTDMCEYTLINELAAIASGHELMYILRRSGTPMKTHTFSDIY